MNTCVINFAETKVGEKLRILVGNNNIAYWNYVSKCFDDNGIKDSFKTWYEKTFRKECKTTDKDFAIRMIRYYNETATKVGRSLRSGVNTSNVGKYNYPSIQDREEGIRHSVGFLLDEFTNIQNQGLTIKGNKREYYANVLQTQFKKHIFNYIAYLNKMSYDDVIADYQEAADKHKYLEKMFGGKNMTITGRNLLAVHDELTSSTESLNSYFNEVLGNKNLQSVLRQINDEKEEDDEDRKDQEEASDNEQDGNSESDTHMREDEGDNYIASANSHMGNYTSFMKHIGARITNYFNSLDKLSSPVRGGTEGNWTYTVDTNNNYGIPDKMDANECSALLYSHARFNNIGEMIQSIEEIGNRMPEFYAFSKLAQDLRDDADFATEMRTVFAKTIMDKVETVLSDNEGSVRISNERANPRSSLMFDMLNDCRGSIIDIQPDLVNNNINKIIADIGQGIKSIKFAQEHIQDLTKEDIAKSNDEAAKYLANTITNVKSLIKAYFPSIQSEAIESYINNGNNANDIASKLDNCRNLINDIVTLVNSAEKVQDNYYNIQDEIERGREYNRNIDSEIKKGNFINIDRVDISSLYSKDYLTDDSNAAVRRLMEKILPYSIVNISLNSRNVYGNQSSDVINNSMVTNITKMLRLTYKDVNGNLVNETLSTWGRNKFRSHQYDYSGYLLETRDDEGNIIKAGLFKDKNGTLSDYAQNLINISLFNGTSNTDDDTNAMYTDQTKGDFLPTAFINFFKTPKEVEGVKTKQDNATYFLRTPSDAPKTFCIRAPRYNTKSFLMYEDDTDKINEIVNGYNKYNAENLPNDLFTPGMGVSGIKEDDLIKGLKNEGNLLITNAQSIHWIDKEKGIAAVNFAYKTNEEYYNNDTINQANGKRYIFVGTIDKSGKALYLKDYHFDGILGTVSTDFDGNIKEVLEGYYSKELKLHDVEVNGKVYSKTNQIVNRNDKLFTRFRNEAKQELLDAAIALDYYFDMTPDGVIKTKLVKGVRKPVFKKDRKNDVGYKFYHLGNNGTVLEEIKKGNKVIGYRLGGTVFGSNKFTLNVLDENGKIVHRNYVNEALFQEGEQEQSDNGKINILYGGAIESNGAYIGTNLNIIRDADGNVSDIQLTDKQQETLDNALEEFILAYSNQAQERCEPYKDFIKGVEYNKDNINNFAINALLNHYNYDSIFEGSVLFYGTGQNVLKRAKEYQGSGVPYGTSNYFEDDAAPNTTVEHSYLNEGYYDVESTSFETVDGKRVKKTIKTPTKIQKIFEGTIFDGVQQTTKFRAITVANTKRTSDAAAQNGPLAKYLAKIYEAAHIDKDKALVMSNELMSGFGGTKVNDAQSYITIQEWVRRIAARGQLRKYMPLIQKLIKGDELSTADVKEFVQVQKNFYYDIHYDDKYKIEVPRQIKNAEFVLIPQFIKGTELEAVYNMMRAAKIDQLNTVETSKAANEEILTLWDNDGRLSGLLEDDGTINENGKFKQFVDKANEIATGNEYLYKYLYTQQETPQHVDAQNKFGIQIAKKIIDNIQILSEDEKKTASADKIALSNLKERYMKLTAANVRDSFNNLMEELEVQLDDEGNIIVDEHDNINNINKKIFYDKLKEELLRTGADSNLMDYVTLENGEPRMKAITVDKITKFESVVQSVFNNRITRQKLPGFHAAQITNMGFKKLGEATGVNNVSYDKDLQYHPDNKGYIEVRLPYSAFGIDRTKPFYKELRAKCANEAEFQDAVLKDLREKGLDIIMGYRIPTEGKQSVCNMKVVSFLDDAQGSTIVVPDDWVSQTGSDFDIDSVYGIQQKTRTTSTGEIKPIQFVEGDVTIGDYANYLREFANNVDSDSEGTKLGNRKKAVKEAIDNIFNSSRAKVKGVFDEIISIKNEQQEVYNNASNSQNEAFENFKTQGPFAGKNLAMVINTIRNNQIAAAKKVEDNGGNKTEQYIAKLEAMNSVLKAIYKKVKLDINNSESAKILLKANDELINILKDNSVNNDNATSEQLAEIYSDRQNELEDIAKTNNLYSFDEFKEAAIDHPEDVNSRDARTNEIFRCMRDILSNPFSLEENLSRSNFDDITDALNDYMNPNVKDERVNRSAYNPFDQMSYQEEAMSGAKLKAFSVTLDTFCSVCNTVRPILSKPIYVVYDKSDYQDPTIIQKRFNDTKEKNLKSSKTFQVRHTTYGWSNDNRCAAGKILTSYSSQTTAYILDAIKSGAIPNVNDYTFAVFKTLANIGCDYKTSISYIMQPGVTEIVNAYNANHSVFSDYQGGNPINDAIKNIAKKMGYKVTNRTSVKELLKKIDEDHHKEFNKIFAQKGEEITISTNYDDIVNLPILVGKNVARLKGEGEFKNPPVGDITTNLFDLGVVLSFGKIYTSAKEIGDIARCCNPDKFGAKQDVYTTNKIFDDAVEMIQKHSEQEPDKPYNRPALVVNKNGKDIHILESIYPGLTNVSQDSNAHGIITENRIAESSYPNLYSYLKYASATSTVVAKAVLPTQNLGFVNLLKGFTRKLNGWNVKLTPKAYKELQSYALGHFYNQCEFVQYPIDYSIDENGQINIHLSENRTDGDFEAERQRIYGYNQNTSLTIRHTVEEDMYKKIDSKRTYITPEEYNGLSSELKANYKLTKVKAKDDVPFEVKDINNITNEEIKEFAKFSPAQKVAWIKKNFDDSGIFSKLQVSLYNPASRGYRVGSQTIEYIEDNANPNIAYQEFYNAFFDNNPLVAMTAYDLIKYAATVEGFKMSQRAITKIIDNKTLIGEFGTNGTGFQDAVLNRINDLEMANNPMTANDADNKFYEEYLRSHPNTEGIKTYSVNKKNNEKYHLNNTYSDIVTINIDKTLENESKEKAKDEFEERLEKVGFITRNTNDNTFKDNQYVRFKSKARGIEIYKIEKIDNNEYIAYPLNKLNINEHGTWSANEDYNIHPRSETYQYIVAQYKADKENAKLDKDYIKEQINDYRENEGNPYYNQRNKNYNIPALDFNLEQLATEDDGNAASIIRQNIIKHFSSLDKYKPLRVKSLTLGRYIISTNSTSTQAISFPDGSKHTFAITKENTRNYDNFYLSNEKYTKEERLAAAYNIKDPLLRDSYVKAIEDNYVHVDNIFKIVENTDILQGDDTSFAASVEESDLSALEYINLAQKGQREIKTGLDEEVSLEVQATQQAKVQGIRLKYDNVRNNVDDATRIVAEYAIKKSKQLITKFNQYVEDPQNPGTYISLTDERIIDAIKNNPVAINNFFKTLNEISAYKARFITYKSCEISTDSPAVKKYVEDINEAYDKLASLDVDTANHNLMENYVSKFSTNPLIREGVLDISENYYKTYGSMWMFHDIMENGNPLLQNILKDVYSHIEAKRMTSLREVRDFNNHINKIIDAAKKEGMTVDINKIIDSRGMLIQDYSQEFLDKMEELRKAKNEAAKLGKGYGSIEYLTAKNKYDQYKAVYTHQAAKQDYYIQKANLERLMIKNHPRIYSRYMTLLYKQLDIYNYMTENGIPEEKQEELNKINDEMFNLQSLTQYYVENGVQKERPMEDPDHDPTDFEYWSNPENDYEASSIYDMHEAKALSDFLFNMKNLNGAYFEYTPKYGFEDLLKKNLNVIRTLEKPDANGVPTQSQEILESNPEYVAAKKWVKENAQYEIKAGKDEDNESINPLADKIIKALNRLKLGGNGKSRTVNSIMRHANNNEGIYDANKVPDGTKLTKDEIDSIRIEMENRYGIAGLPAGSDIVMISNAKPDGPLLNAAFYSRYGGGKKINTPEYVDVITQINKIHQKYWNPIDKTVNLQNIPDNEAGYEELKKLDELYQKLRQIRAANSEILSEETIDFRQLYTEFKINIELGNEQARSVVGKSDKFRELYLNVVLEKKLDGTIRTDENGVAVPNRLLYGYLTLKDDLSEEEKNRFIDKQRQEDLNLIDKSYKTVHTKYWEKALAEAHNRRDSDPSFDYNAWWNSNHVYNPYTREMELLPCWTTKVINSEYMENGTFLGEWVPRANMRTKKVKDGTVIDPYFSQNHYYFEENDMRDKDYKDDASLAANYIKGANNGKYDNNIQLNDREKELRDYIQNTLIKTAGNIVSRRYFESGRLPQRRKADPVNAKMVLKETGKLVGIGISTNNGKKDFDEYIGYDNDVTPIMPMLKDIVSSKVTKVVKPEELDAALKSDYTVTLDSKKFKKPERLNYETDEDYTKALAEYEATQELVKNHNEKVRKDNLDRNWIDVISDYINQASRYNAIQDSKEKLYWLLEELRHQQAYIRKYGATGDLRLDNRRSTDDNNVYQTSTDDNLIKQYENQLRRLLWDQWKEPENHMTRWANQLQTFTSANYMMLNIRGGIANVTVGMQSIFGEAMAGDGFTAKGWRWGIAEWHKGLPGMAAGMYDEKAHGKVDGVIKLFKAVDYDEITGVVRNVGLAKWSERIRNAGFSPQTITENFMQNGVLLAMLHEHKIITIDGDDIRGIGARIMNKREYWNYKKINLLADILGEEQFNEYKKFKEEKMKDPNLLKDYAWFRKDLATDFVWQHCSPKQRAEYIKKQKEIKAKVEKEFDAKTDIYSQLEEKNGYIQFKQNSDLAKLDEFRSDKDGEDVTKAYALLGEFSEKVRKSNNYIHGVYNRQGMAYIEKTWYGSLVMQYHKHLPMGLMKRYHTRGNWNEVRNSVNKGMIASCIDFLKLDIDLVKHDAGLSDDEVTALKGVQNILTHSYQLLTHLKTTWELMPDYDKANIKRNLGDLIGVLGGITGSIALIALGADDDKDKGAFENIMANLALYESDRLTSESFMYNPIGMQTELKTLMSTPLAAQSIITDGLKSIYEIGAFIMQGDDFDPIYKSGRFAGENRLGVYIQRRIPMWNGIRQVIDSPANNHYYKVGDTACSLINTKGIGNWIGGRGYDYGKED